MSASNEDRSMPIPYIRLSTVEAERKEFGDTIDELRKKLEASETENKNLSGQLEESEKARICLESKNAVLREKCREVETRAGEDMQRMIQGTNILKVVTDARNKLKAENKELLERIRKMEKEMETFDDDNVRLLKKIVELEFQHSRNLDELKQSKDQNLVIHQALRNKHATVEKRAEQIDELKREIASLRWKLKNEEEKQISDCDRKSKQEMSEELERVRAENSKLIARIECLEHNLCQTTNDLVTAQKTISGLKLLLKDFQGQYLQLDNTRKEDVAFLVKLNVELVKKNDDLKDDIRALEEELFYTQSERQTYLQKFVSDPVVKDVREYYRCRLELMAEERDDDIRVLEEELFFLQLREAEDDEWNVV